MKISWKLLLGPFIIDMRKPSASEYSDDDGSLVISS